MLCDACMVNVNFDYSMVRDSKDFKISLFSFFRLPFIYFILFKIQIETNTKQLDK